MLGWQHAFIIAKIVPVIDHTKTITHDFNECCQFNLFSTNSRALHPSDSWPPYYNILSQTIIKWAVNSTILDTQAGSGDLTLVSGPRYPRRTAPQFLPAAAMTALLITSISASLNVAFCGVRVMLTASDFWPSSIFLP